MALSFEDEVRGYIQNAAEQNPVLHALETGTATIADIGVQELFEMSARISAMHTQLIIKTAQEIDKLRAAIDSG